LSHVPGARRDDPVRELIRRGRADRGEGAAQLERADRMETFELQQDPVVRPQWDKRRAKDVVADSLARPADLLERDQSDSLASSVRSVRTVQSSGNILCLISPASSSTGVPCVPTTSSPITRPTIFTCRKRQMPTCSSQSIRASASWYRSSCSRPSLYTSTTASPRSRRRAANAEKRPGETCRIPRKPGESKPEPCPSTRRTSWYSQGDMSSRCSRNVTT